MSSMAKMRFATSIPGVAKKFFGFGDYLSHCPIIAFPQFSSHRVKAAFGKTQFRGVKPDKLPIQSYAFTLPVRFYITILVLGTSNPAGITATFGFQFQECINVVHENYHHAPVSGFYWVI